MIETTAGQAAFLREAHALLESFYDIDRWHWTEDSQPFEICLGSILVQHTGWTNVEKALANLQQAGIHSLEAITALPEDELALLVRPVGTPLTKARRLQSFASLVAAHDGFEGLFALPAAELRRLLLSTNGIGPETADVILLYGARAPVVVVDAYTARLFRRLGLGPERDGYDRWQAWLEDRLPPDARYRGRHHAAIVVHCKLTCRTRPRCNACPLTHVCAASTARHIAAGE